MPFLPWGAKIWPKIAAPFFCAKKGPGWTKKGPGFRGVDHGPLFFKKIVRRFCSLLADANLLDFAEYSEYNPNT